MSSSSPQPAAAAATAALPRVINFNAGPGALPLSVLQTAQASLLNYEESGMSVMEMSHRSDEFEKIINNAEANLRTLMNIPDNYHVLFMQGGGTGQFAAIPLNFLPEDGTGRAAYVISGSWSKKAADEAQRYGVVDVVATGTDDTGAYTHAPHISTWKTMAPNTSYVYICANETVNGVEFATDDDTFGGDDGVPVVADFSSSFLSRPIDIRKYAMVYAGAQKNIGPAGVTVVIVRNDMLGRARASCPTVLNYSVMAKAKSMYNTPPCWNIYMVGLVFEWMRDVVGGVEAMGQMNARKAAAVYEVLDKYPDVYTTVVKRESRSRMNVVFRIQQQNEELENEFVATAATKHRMIGLAGHRSVGGVRASIYNATLEAKCWLLCDYLHEFAKTVCV